MTTALTTSLAIPMSNQKRSIDKGTKTGSVEGMTREEWMDEVKKTDASVDVLVTRTNAWQLYSRLISDPTKLKAKVLAIGTSKSTSASPSWPAPSPLSSSSPSSSNGASAPPVCPADESAFCRKKRHWKEYFAG